MPAPLPPEADLDQLRETAATLRDWARAGEPGALELVRAHHPGLADLQAGTPAATGFELADAQLTLARHHGHPDWPALEAQVELRRQLARSPHLVPVGGDLADDDQRADELCRLACLTYGADDPARPARARALLAEHPDLARRSAHAAASVGDVEALRAVLDRDPGAVDRRGGPFDWVPLLHAAYSRLDGDTLGCARLLLDRGADPDAGYLWEGLTPPFTALTGAFGRGEGQQPPHPQALALARLLLEAGADPHDGQTVYNTGLGDLPRDDTEPYELLFEFGFGAGPAGAWSRRLGGDHPAPEALLGEAFQHAVEAGLVARVRLMLAHGADPDGRGLHPAFAGRTAYEGAVRAGNTEVVALLEAAGADRAAVGALPRFLGACLAGDRAAVDAALADGPGLLVEAQAAEPMLVARAVVSGRATAVRLAVDLGWDVNAERRSTALHEAAFRGDEALVDLLVSLGADPRARDDEFDGTPAGWAFHGGHPDLAQRLERLAGG